MKGSSASHMKGSSAEGPLAVTEYLRAHGGEAPVSVIGGKFKMKRAELLQHFDVCTDPSSTSGQLIVRLHPGEDLPPEMVLSENLGAEGEEASVKDPAAVAEYLKAHGGEAPVSIIGGKFKMNRGELLQHFDVCTDPSSTSGQLIVRLKFGNYGAHSKGSYGVTGKGCGGKGSRYSPYDCKSAEGPVAVTEYLKAHGGEAPISVIGSKFKMNRAELLQHFDVCTDPSSSSGQFIVRLHPGMLAEDLGTAGAEDSVKDPVAVAEYLKAHGGEAPVSVIGGKFKMNRGELLQHFDVCKDPSSTSGQLIVRLYPGEDLPPEMVLSENLGAEGERESVKDPAAVAEYLKAHGGEAPVSIIGGKFKMNRGELLQHFDVCTDPSSTSGQLIVRLKFGNYGARSKGSYGVTGKGYDGKGSRYSPYDCKSAEGPVAVTEYLKAHGGEAPISVIGSKFKMNRGELLQHFDVCTDPSSTSGQLIVRLKVGNYGARSKGSYGVAGKGYGAKGSRHSPYDCNSAEGPFAVTEYLKVHGGEAPMSVIGGKFKMKMAELLQHFDVRADPSSTSGQFIVRLQPGEESPPKTVLA